MYYLQSRYYNPEWGRFANADGIIGNIGKLLSHNMFAYCENNAINGYDPSGYQNIADCMAGGGVAEVVLTLYVTLATNPEIINEFEEAFMNAMILTEHLEVIRLAKATNNSNALSDEELKEQQGALDKLGKEIEERYKRTKKKITKEESEIIDDWCDQYNVPQHHKTGGGLPNHWKEGDHTHIRGRHIPYVET